MGCAPSSLGLEIQREVLASAAAQMQRQAHQYEQELHRQELGAEKQQQRLTDQQQRLADQDQWLAQQRQQLLTQQDQLASQEQRLADQDQWLAHQQQQLVAQQGQLASQEQQLQDLRLTCDQWERAATLLAFALLLTWCVFVLRPVLLHWLRRWGWLPVHTSKEAMQQLGHGAVGAAGGGGSTPDVRSWFDSEEHADVLLRVLVQPGQPDLGGGAELVQAASNYGHLTAKGADQEVQGKAAAAGSPGGQCLKTYHAHALVLAAHSAQLEVALSSLGQRTAGGCVIAAKGNAGVGYHVEVHLSADELSAFDLLLRLMYGQELPAVTPDTMPLLFRCLWLADRFGAVQCVDLILGRLQSIDTIRTQVMQHVFSAPPGVATRTAHKQLAARCMCLLMQAFQRVPAVLRDPARKSDFCALPFPVVLAWAQADEPHVYGASCVERLLKLWVEAAEAPGGQGVSSQQLEQLAGCVRGASVRVPWLRRRGVMLQR